MRAIILLLALSFLAPATAFADGVTRAELSRAKSLFKKAERDYASGRYERAVARYKEAYELSERPQLLFNIANAYERLGRYGDAATYLRRYLEDAKVNNRDAIEQRIARLEEKQKEHEALMARLEAAQASADRPAPTEAPAALPAEKPGPATPPTMPRYKWWIGGGAVALVAAGVFGFASFSAGNQAENQCVNGLCPASAGGHLSRERGFAIAADLTAAAGLAALGYGSYLWWKSERQERRAPVAISPVVSPDGLGIAIAGEL